MNSARFEPSEEVLSGETADVYFQHTLNILKHENSNPTVVMEFFTRTNGILCGIEEVKSFLNKILDKSGCEVWMLREGDSIHPKEVALRIKAPYCSFGLYETAIDGILASCTGWATAAKQCVDAAQGLPVISFGARHVHPNAAAVMDYSSIVGGCKGCSTTAGAHLAGLNPSGTMPHALILIMGDTVKATIAFDKYSDPGIPRISLVDTFMDEDRESIRVAGELKERLASVRLDTPSELGGVTPELVSRVRTALDSNGFTHVGIFVSGGMNPDRITEFVKSGTPVTGFGVGSYISNASPIDFTADIHEIDGVAIAKRGRTAGITVNDKLIRFM